MQIVKSRILLVEDEAMIAMALEDALTDAGFTVELASNAAVAIDRLQRDHDKIVAVVTDIRMPGPRSGWDVGHRARELEPDIPLIYCSGDKASEWSAQGVPGSVMLHKPFALEQLVTAVSQLVNERSSSLALR
ncbi:response regulator [Devosia sp. CAU 1758]